MTHTVQKVLFVSAQKWENGIWEKQQQRRTTTTWEVGDGSCRPWRRERGGRTIFNLGWQNPNRQPLMFLGVITTSVAKQRARRRKEEEEEEVSLSSQVRGVEKRKGQSPPFSGGGQKIAASSS